MVGCRPRPRLLDRGTRDADRCVGRSALGIETDTNDNSDLKAMTFSLDGRLDNDVNAVAFRLECSGWICADDARIVIPLTAHKNYGSHLGLSPT
jgi:hypothetical protein